MNLRAALLGGLVALCAAGTPALAAPSAYDGAFVAAFEEACVPGRLGFQSTRDTAEAAGWQPVMADSHPELAALLAASEALANDPELQSTYEMTAYARQVDGLPHFLVVARTSAVITEGEAPFVQVGCYLYNFEATSPVDPEPVTALIGNPISQSQEQGTTVTHVWGPGCTMPRTFDTYLSFVAEGSEAAAAVPFTGVALNFTTSEPAPGEDVPDTYCTDGASLDVAPELITVAATAGGPPADEVEFVSQFADACTTGRASLADNKAAAEAAGWVTVVDNAHPELGSIIGFSNQAAADIRANNGEFDSAVYQKPIGEVMHYLIVSDALIGYGPARENILGCYLYGFDAATQPDPEVVTALTGVEPTAYQVDQDVASWQWNAPQKFPGVMDIYLTYVPEESQYRTQYGFSGVVLQLNTAVPNPTAIPGTETTGE